MAYGIEMWETYQSVMLIIHPSTFLGPCRICKVGGAVFRKRCSLMIRKGIGSNGAVTKAGSEFVDLLLKLRDAGVGLLGALLGGSSSHTGLLGFETALARAGF